MKSGNTRFWRLAARVIFVPLFAWLLVAQAVLMPMARAHAAARAGQDSALLILCSSTLSLPGDAGDDAGTKRVHDLGCCTLAGRADLDLPVATLAAPLPLVAPAQAVHRMAYALPQGRAPPAITATPTQARAPPHFPDPTRCLSAP